MAKRSLLRFLKRLFSPEANTMSDKKEKRRRWMSGRLKMKRYSAITASTKDGALYKAEDEQSAHAVNMAIPSTVTAEVAAAAAQVSAEVARTRFPHQCQKDVGEQQVMESQKEAPGSTQQDGKEPHDIAANKIQTTFRGLLARKALRALRGIVRLQAIIRGQVVRRQAMNTLKNLQSIMNIQSRLTARQNQTTEKTWDLDSSIRFHDLRERLPKMEFSVSKRWDDSLLSKDDVDAVYLSKIEAAIKKERVKEYSIIHRKSADTERKRRTGRCWLEQWVDNQLGKSKGTEDWDSYVCPYRRFSEGYGENLPKVRTIHRLIHNEAVENPSAARRTVQNIKQCYIADGSSFLASHMIPTYMAATESTMAKSRSARTPKLRPKSYDAYSEYYSPALTTSIKSEVPSSKGRVISRTNSYQQRSPSLKGIPGRGKSYHISEGP